MTLIAWLRNHLVPHHEPHPPPALREASHRLANERMKLHGEVAHRVGGPQNLELLIKRMKDDREWT